MAGRDLKQSGRDRRGRGGKTAAVSIFMLSRVFLAGLITSCLRRLKPAVRRTVLGMLAAGLVLTPLPAAFGHVPELSAAEDGQVQQATADHGHGHEHGEGHAPPAGHLHGHDPADHSHQFALLSAGGNQWGLPSPRRWSSSPSGMADQATGLGIERPPKKAISL